MRRDWGRGSPEDPAGHESSMVGGGPVEGSVGHSKDSGYFYEIR